MRVRMVISPQRPDKTPDGWSQDGDGLYRGGDPAAPKLGDLRVRYKAIPSPAPVSIMARQMGPGFETYDMPNGYAIFFVADGMRSPCASGVTTVLENASRTG